jgi:hypothetical protein
MTTIKLIPLLAALLLATAPAFADERADALLAAAKAATGGSAWDQIVTWHESGRLETAGLVGTYEEWIDLPAARLAASSRLGALSTSRGWDGTQSWTTDSSGQVRVESAGDAVAENRQQIYAATLAFWYPERMPAERIYVGERQADGVGYDAVEITPAGAEPLELWIERRTHRITRSVQLTGDHPETQIFSDFRAIAGVTVPYRTRTTTGQAKFDVVSTTTLAAVNETIAPGRFAAPPTPVDDTQFPAGADRVTLPFQQVDGDILLPISLNGAAAIGALFDTGAVNMLNRSEAAALGLEAKGALPMGGFGTALATSGVAKVATVDLGGLRLKDQIFFTVDLGAAEAAGLSMQAAIGYDIARRAVTVIDYAGSRITFIKPASFHPAPEAVAIPFKFTGHIPVIEASLDGIAGEFQIDTGARPSLVVMEPFSRAHDLVRRYQASRTVVAGSGVGGMVRALLFRPASLKIGPFEIRQPVGDLLLDRSGAAADPRTSGNIGAGILRRFTLTLDYARQMLYLVPNARFAEPDVADRSGLWLVRSGPGALAVADVVANSPAAEAGLLVGDLITAIDGLAASSLGGAEVSRRLAGPPGTLVRVTVRTPAGPRQLTIILADLV